MRARAGQGTEVYNKGKTHMTNLKQLCTTGAVLGICTMLMLNSAPAQILGTTPGTLHYPLAIAAKEVKTEFAVSFSRMPVDVVEESASIRWPLFTLEAHYGLPKNFLLDGRINTQIITNHLLLGGKWVYAPYERLHLSVGYDLAYWFGQLKQYGFNNTAHGWINYPNLTIGYDFGKVALSVKAEASIVTSLTTYADDIKVSTDQSFFNGGSFTVYLEQPLWKDNTISLAYRANFLKFFYPEWLLFPTINKFYFIPELEVGFRL
jgi:hypothetical protein